MYSLGNPLDVGFAVIEGNYNGLVERSFYPQIFFAGSLSGGMSGGPALDQEGRVIGVNVARRVDGEQVSFLVPGPLASALLARAARRSRWAGAAWPSSWRSDAHRPRSPPFHGPGLEAGHPPRYTVRCHRTGLMVDGAAANPRAPGPRFERSDA